jgi:hypothetical protein
VDNMCCDCWTEGCGCDGCFGCVADGLEAVNPAMEYVADLIWVCGSPLAFPLVFCFDSGPPTDPPGGGWQLPMIETPLRRPIQCCLFSTCCPCGQWYMRYRLLGGDMTKYKLWQGYHDGPHCCARRCPGAPCTIASGTYGEGALFQRRICVAPPCTLPSSLLHPKKSAHMPFWGRRYVVWPALGVYVAVLMSIDA